MQLCPGEITISIDEGACVVVFKLDSDGGAFEVALEPAAAYQLGFQLIDKALRACRGAWAARA